MRRALTVLCAVVTVALLPGCSNDAATSPHPGTPVPSTNASTSASSTATADPVARTLEGHPVIAHRGGPARHAEESMAAYRAASAADFPLEMDVQRLADGTLVLMHDDTVDRTTDGTGPVKDLTRAGWGKLRLADGTAPPTWDAVVKAFGDDLLVPEVKAPDALHPLIESIRSHHLQKQVVAQSFLPGDARALAAAGIPSMLLTSAAKPATDLPGLRTAGIDYVGASAATPDLAGYADRTRAAGLGFTVWTVNDPSAAAALVRSGVASVFTNDPWAASKAISAG
jgi:glycerophosphoryl diester phosphodiesterase